MGPGSTCRPIFDRVNRQQSTQAEFRDTFDLDFVHHFKWKGTQFTWGFGARTSAATVPVVVPTYVFTPNRRTDNLFSVFVQDEIPIVTDRLSFTIGSKVLHSAFSGFDAEPSARLLWTPSARTTFLGLPLRGLSERHRISRKT